MNASYIDAMDEPEALKAQFRADLSDHWRCVICSWEIRMTEPLVIGAFCCGRCGMSTLRPVHAEANDA